jgi:membrane protease YdiL (CAAX protease family)
VSDDPPQPRELRPLGALLLVLIHAMGTWLIVSAGQALIGEDAELSIVLVLGAQVAAGLIALYVGLVRHAPHEATSVALRLGRPDAHAWKLIGLGVAYGMLAAAPLYAIAEWVLRASGAEAENAAAQAVATPGEMWIVAAGALVAAPLVNEALYRGLIQPRLVRVAGVAQGIAMSVMFSAVAQLGPVVAGILGFGSAILAHAAASTWPAVAAAGVAPLALAVYGGGASWPMVAVSTVAAAGVLLLTWRVRRPR